MLSLSLHKVALATILGLASLAQAGTRKQITEWGDNPTNLGAVIVYTPDQLSESPAVVLAVSIPNIRNC